jgi:hypothetical protein
MLAADRHVVWLMLRALGAITLHMRMCTTTSGRSITTVLRAWLDRSPDTSLATGIAEYAAACRYALVLWARQYVR